jgi:hypothetical protein
MQTILLSFAALIFVANGALAQVNAQTSMQSCAAPVALDNKDCNDVLKSGAPSGAEGSFEQRDDGYYVFVPPRGD